MQEEIKRPYVEVVWHQTEQLEIKPENQPLARLQSALAFLLTQSPDELSRFSRRALVARDQDQMARLDATKKAVTQGLSDPPEIDEPLPTSIAILPLNENGDVKGILPNDFSWVAETEPTALFNRRHGIGQIGYFEMSEPRESQQASICTVAQLSRDRTQNPKRRTGIVVTVLGLFIFLIAMGSTMKTGSVIADAHRNLTTAQYDADSSFQTKITQYCQTDDNLCQGKNTETILDQCISSFTPEKPEDTQVLKLSKLCSVVWKHALESADLPKSKTWMDNLANGVSLPFNFFYKNGETLASSNQLSLVSYFYFALIGLAMLFAGLGLTTSGRVIGVAINVQNRLSLSLLQVVIWTIIILSAYATFCAFNVGAMGSNFSVNEINGANESTSLFPELETWMWAVMGIVVASPTLSALIKGGKLELEDIGIEDRKNAESRVLNLTLGSLSRNASPTEASFFDIFLGEDVNNTTRLDISRAQNVIITALLLFTFSGWLVHSMSAIGANSLLAAFANAQPILANFPEPGATFTGLLALTHATYLAGKWKPGQS